MLVYNAVTELPIRSFLLLAAVADLELTPLAVVLKHPTQRQDDCFETARDHNPCILRASLANNGLGEVSEYQWIGLLSEPGRQQQVYGDERGNMRCGNNRAIRKYRDPVQTQQTS
jgi:hypothetical protein